MMIPSKLQDTITQERFDYARKVQSLTKAREELGLIFLLEETEKGRILRKRLLDPGYSIEDAIDLIDSRVSKLPSLEKEGKVENDFLQAVEENGWPMIYDIKELKEAIRIYKEQIDGQFVLEEFLKDNGYSPKQILQALSFISWKKGGHNTIKGVDRAVDVDLLPCEIDTVSDREDVLEMAINSLTLRQQRVIRGYYGIGQERKTSLGNIAKDFDLGIERIRQYKEVGLRRLRKIIPIILRPIKGEKVSNRDMQQKITSSQPIHDKTLTQQTQREFTVVDELGKETTYITNNTNVGMLGYNYPIVLELIRKMRNGSKEKQEQLKAITRQFEVRGMVMDAYDKDKILVTLGLVPKEQIPIENIKEWLVQNADIPGVETITHKEGVWKAIDNMIHESLSTRGIRRITKTLEQHEATMMVIALFCIHAVQSGSNDKSVLDSLHNTWISGKTAYSIIKDMTDNRCMGDGTFALPILSDIKKVIKNPRVEVSLGYRLAIDGEIYNSLTHGAGGYNQKTLQTRLGDIKNGNDESKKAQLGGMTKKVNIKGILVTMYQESPLLNLLGLESRDNITVSDILNGLRNEGKMTKEEIDTVKKELSTRETYDILEYNFCKHLSLYDGNRDLIVDQTQNKAILTLIVLSVYYAQKEGNDRDSSLTKSLHDTFIDGKSIYTIVQSMPNTRVNSDIIRLLSMSTIQRILSGDTNKSTPNYEYNINGEVYVYITNSLNQWIGKRKHFHIRNEIERSLEDKSKLLEKSRKISIKGDKEYVVYLKKDVEDFLATLESQ